MRQLDKVGTALADALGFSTKHTEARMKVICHGVDKDSQETIVIVECRIRARRTPLERTGENAGNSKKGTTGTKKKPVGLKSPGKPMTPHKSLIQELHQLAADRG